MQKFKKVLKWIGISIGSLIALFIFLGIVLPKQPTTDIKNDVSVIDPVEQNIDTTPVVSETPVELEQPIVAAEQPSTSTPDPKPSSTPPKVVSNPTPASSQYTYYKVTEVVDGDTIKISMNGSIETLRLIGIDTPETVDPRKPVQCFGKEASNKAKELLSGKKVRIETDPTQGERDKYDRLLAYVYREDGLFYNKVIIEDGYAHEYTYNKPYKYQTQFKLAQQSAQAGQKGLWSPTTCNGDTTTAATTTTPASSGNYYTSSYSTSKYYYPATCEAWKTLTPSYLKSFSTLEELLAAYPNRTLSPQCN